MPESVIDAIRQGIWNYEPASSSQQDYDSTNSMPGTPEKLEVLARRLSSGKPLWHPSDRIMYRDYDEE